MSGTGGRDTPVSTASPKKPGIMKAGGVRGTPDPESAPVESLINTISSGPRKSGLGSPSNTYEVKSGDTLSEIAQDFGTTVEELAKINNIEDPDKILAGQKLKLKDTTPDVDYSDPTQAPTGAVEAAEAFTADNVDFDFIGEQEGAGINEAYVPEDEDGKPLGQSGVTVGTGVDLGSKDEEYFEGLDPNLIEKIEPYLGQKKENAQTLLQIAPLNLSDTEVAQLNRFVKEKELKNLKDKWNRDSDIDFDDLPKNKATVVASVYYQYGNKMIRDHNFWNQVTSGNWDAALKNLRNYGDDYKSRRGREADYLESGEL